MRLFTLRACPPTHLHAAQFLRSAAYSQRNFHAAQFLLFLANWGGPQGWDPWDPKEGPPWGPWAPLLRTEGPLRGPWAQGGGRLRRPWAHGGRWDDSEAAPNGMFFRWRFALSHRCIAEVGQNRTHFLTSEALLIAFRCFWVLLGAFSCFLNALRAFKYFYMLLCAFRYFLSAF